jgi:hypothetical protein
MKKQFLIFIAVIVSLSALAANAPAQRAKTVKADVNFDFQIGDKTYPAGEYLIESVNNGGNALRMKGAGKGNNRLLIAGDLYTGGRLQQPKLVFRRAGDNYYLTQVFLESGAWGFSVRNTSKRFKTDLASKPVETIEVRAKN